MKRISNFLAVYVFILSINFASARDIILIENLATSEEAALLIKIITEKFHIPRNMISLKTPLQCSKPNEAIMHLCLKQDGVLDVMQVNRFVVKNSLSAFYDESSENLTEKRL